MSGLFIIKAEDMLVYSESLGVEVNRGDVCEIGEGADAVFQLDRQAVDVPDVFEDGFNLAIKLAKAREDGTDARAFYADYGSSGVRLFFIAASEELAVARAAALSIVREKK